MFSEFISFFIIFIYNKCNSVLSNSVLSLSYFFYLAIREAGTSGLPIGYNKASCQAPAPPSRAEDPWTSCLPVKRHREFAEGIVNLRIVWHHVKRGHTPYAYL